ncbi:MAG TPA: YebC/PmpR family DNA-binding transcriptional regulator, partial [Arenibaculum sp.]|nr:YebC/PmpR family DNA-binding transcriptional regulator [Arenibaculum sp.]
DDVASDPDAHTIYPPFESTAEVAEALTASLGEPKTVNIVWRPKSLVPVSGDQAATLMKLIEALEDDDDVQNVYANFDISDEEMARLAS